jgi:hypothetical protein
LAHFDLQGREAALFYGRPELLRLGRLARVHPDFTAPRIEVKIDSCNTVNALDRALYVIRSTRSDDPADVDDDDRGISSIHCRRLHGDAAGSARG